MTASGTDEQVSYFRIQIPLWLHYRLRSQRLLTGMSLSDIVSEALDPFLLKQGREAAPRSPAAHLMPAAVPLVPPPVHVTPPAAPTAVPGPPAVAMPKPREKVQARLCLLA